MSAVTASESSIEREVQVPDGQTATLHTRIAAELGSSDARVEVVVVDDGQTEVLNSRDRLELTLLRAAKGVERK